MGCPVQWSGQGIVVRLGLVLGDAEVTEGETVVEVDQGPSKERAPAAVK